MAESLKFLLIVALMLFAGIETLRAKGLLRSSLWLAVVSVMSSILLFNLSTVHLAVVELSVGAGLVTILFIFAISVAGEERVEKASVVPRALAGVLVIASMTMFFILGRSSGWLEKNSVVGADATNFIQVRGLDLLIQGVLIFAGVLGLVGILAEAKPPLEYPMAEEVAAQREQALLLLETQSQDSLGNPGAD